MADRESHIEADTIANDAWKLVNAFDDRAEAMQLTDRRVGYAALIMLMITFVRSSETQMGVILDDFCERVTAGASAPEATKQ